MEHVSNNTFGTLGSAPDGKIVQTIFAYITTVLCEFKGVPDENENAITNRLCKTLEFKKPPEYPFFFHHQNLEDEKENTSTDFAAFGTFAYAQTNGDFPLVKFEAKRLSSALPLKRRKEYVIGEYENGEQTKNSGGIERFKNERHGKNVMYAGIIGYVQTDSLSDWLERINGWIKEEINDSHDLVLKWDSDDYLQLNWSGNNVSCHSSRHKRKTLAAIEMRHIWIKLN